MTLNIDPMIEADWDPCPCGGPIYITCSIIGQKKKVNARIMHFIVRCQKCGSWRGGFMAKYARVRLGNMEVPVWPQ